jgi:hypothetical protein
MYTFQSFQHGRRLGQDLLVGYQLKAGHTLELLVPFQSKSLDQERFHHFGFRILVGCSFLVARLDGRQPRI